MATRRTAECTSSQPHRRVERPLLRMNTIDSEEMSKLDFTPLCPLAASASKRCRLTADESRRMLVVKRFEPSERKSFVWESRQLFGLADVPRVQQAVAVCPSTMEIVSGYLGVPSNQFVNGATPLSHLWTILFQVAQTVQGMHRQGMCYNGLRPSNVCVVMMGNSPCVTLVDMELCTLTESHLPIERKEGWAKSYPWLAPEVKRGEVCSEASDVYSLGQLMVKLISCKGYFNSRRKTLKILSAWINQSREWNQEKRGPLADVLKILGMMRRTSHRNVGKRRLSSEEKGAGKQLQPQQETEVGKEISKLLLCVLKKGVPEYETNEKQKIELITID